MNLEYSNLYKHKFHQVKISPNGHYLANSVDNRLVIREYGRELDILMVYNTIKPIEYIAWSPNSEYILTVNYEFSRIDIWSTTNVNFRMTIKDPRMTMVTAKWSPNSKNIFYTVDMKLFLGIWNLAKGELKYIYHIKYSEKCIESSPDEKYIAVARENRNSGKDCISIYHSASFIQLQDIEVDTADLQNFKWSPDSTYLAIWDNCLYHRLLVYRSDGVKCMDYSGYEFGLGIKTVSWSPDGQLLALGNFDQTIHLINTTTWKVISTLDHPTTIISSMNTHVIEEILLPPYSLPTLSEATTDYRHITKRPFTIPITRPDTNKPDPKIGIGLMQFSPDGRYIYSRNDNMHNMLWIWHVKTLYCYNIIQFKNPIKQAIWNPREEHMLLTICGDENLHVFQPTESDHDETDIISLRVSISDFTVKKAKWNSNGDSLVLMDDDLFSLAVMSL